MSDYFLNDHKRPTYEVPFPLPSSLFPLPSSFFPLPPTPFLSPSIHPSQRTVL